MIYSESAVLVVLYGRIHIENASALSQIEGDLNFR